MAAVAMFLVLVGVLAGALIVRSNGTGDDAGASGSESGGEVIVVTSELETDSTNSVDGSAATLAPETLPIEPESRDTDPDTTEVVIDITAQPTTTVVPARGAGDLGLAQPILDEPCDGRYITFVGSAVGDLPYADAITELLAQFPGTNYLWTKSCPSLRQTFTDGSDIYGVVFGPFASQDEACAAAAAGPDDAYVRRISSTDAADHTVSC